MFSMDSKNTEICENLILFFWPKFPFLGARHIYAYVREKEAL